MKKFILIAHIMCLSPLMGYSQQTIYRAENVQISHKVPETDRKDRPAKVKRVQATNLPAYHQRPVRSVTNKSEQSAIITPKSEETRLFGITPGDMFDIEILHSIIAFPDEKTPVVAEMKSGPYRGAKLVGNAILEKNSERILIEFSTLSFSNYSYRFIGSAVTASGITGFKGVYHSREGEYFAADFTASFVAAYFDSLVPRQRTFLGNIEDNSVDSALKKGVASGALSTAERFREKLKKAPQFSELYGPFTAQLLIISTNLNN